MKQANSTAKSAPAKSARLPQETFNAFLATCDEAIRLESLQRELNSAQWVVGFKAVR